MELATATLLSGLASAAATGSSALASGRMNKRAEKYNREAMQKQQDFQREQANTQYERQMQILKYQNDYDSAASQMQRFKQAGLNPNLIYGQIGQGSAPSVPLGDSSAPPQQTSMQQSSGWSGLTQSLQAFMPVLAQLGQADANIKNLNADTKGKEITNLNLDEKQKGEIDLLHNQKEEIDQKIENLQDDLRNNSQLREESQRRIDKLIAEVEQMQQLTPHMMQKLINECANIAADSKLKGQQAKNLKQEFENYLEYRQQQLNLMQQQQNESEARTSNYLLQNEINGWIKEMIDNGYKGTSDMSSKLDRLMGILVLKKMLGLIGLN